VEDACNCPADCAGFCGDGCCSGVEDACSCPADCTVPSCGDGCCSAGEDFCNCPSECADFCGDGCCSASEDIISCPGDCPLCGQGANIAPSATATSSGGGSGSYGPAVMNDGLYEASCGFCWVSAGSTPGTAWIQYTWATPQDLWGMWLDSPAAMSTACSSSGRSLDGGTVQYWNAGWVDVQTYSDMADDWYPGPTPIQFAAPITTTQLRIYGVHADTLGAQNSNPMIFEWEVLECN
jgi:hypothetical protein